MKFAFAPAAATALLLSSTAVSALGLFSHSSGAKNVEATAAFPESNPFSHILNGRNNDIKVVINNKEDVEIELKKVFGSFKNAQTEKFIRNTTSLAYSANVSAKNKATIPYAFYSEFKPQDIRLELWVEYTAGGQPYVVQAFNSIVSVVEPPASIFDPTLILTYLIILGLFGGVGYLTYQSYFPQKKVKRTIPTPSAPLEVKGTTTSGYEEEWIPEHHLKSRKGKTSGAASSGDESGPEKKTKGKK